MTNQDETRDPIELLLGQALSKIEAPPKQTIDAAKALADFIDLDASLARLLDAEQPALRDPGVRQDTYEWDDGTTLHLQTSPSGDDLQLTGVLDGAAVDAMTLQGADGSTIAVQLAHGSFEAVAPAGRWFRMLFTSQDQDYVTPWAPVETTS